TFDWHSIRPSTLRRMPVSETVVMLATVIPTVATHNLAIGVVVGVVTACVLFARRVAHLVSVRKVPVQQAPQAPTMPDDAGSGAAGSGHEASGIGMPGDAETVRYVVDGELFFASSNDLYTRFDYAGDPGNVVIDLSNSHVWDASTVAALDAVTEKYRQHGKSVEIVGLNKASAAFRDRLSGQLGE
ncbi:MAG: STAS domain-containing protein, partial [Galactobacter sp.]